MTNFLVRFLFCVTILSLNVQSQYLDNNGFPATPGVVEVTPGVDSVTPNEIGHYAERGLWFPKISLPNIGNLLGFTRSKAKPSHKLKNGTVVVDQSPFEKTYRARVALIQKLGDNIHDAFDDFTKFLLLFVGKDRRSLLSIKNVNNIKILGERVVNVSIIGIILLNKLIEDVQSIFNTFTTKPNQVIKIILEQVLKAINLPPFARNVINDTVGKFIKD